MTKSALNSFATDTKQSISERGILSGYRNKIINGDFAIAQRGTSVALSSTGYSLDRWLVAMNGQTCTASRAGGSVGNTSVGKYYGQFAFSGTGGSAGFVSQKIEGVETLNGETVTLSFYIADTVDTTVTVYLRQNFGTGGSPSANVDTTVNITGITNAFAGKGYVKLTLNLPSIAGKTLGTNGDDCLQLIFQSSTSSAHTLSLGLVSLVEGDATGEAEPFSKRHPQQELALCQRYYQTFSAYAVNSASFPVSPIFTRVPMRATPTGTSTAGTIVVVSRDFARISHTAQTDVTVTFDAEL